MRGSRSLSRDRGRLCPRVSRSLVFSQRREGGASAAHGNSNQSTPKEPWNPLIRVTVRPHRARVAIERGSMHPVAVQRMLPGKLLLSSQCQQVLPMFILVTMMMKIHSRMSEQRIKVVPDCTVV